MGPVAKPLRSLVLAALLLTACSGGGSPSSQSAPVAVAQATTSTTLGSVPLTADIIAVSGDLPDSAKPQVIQDVGALIDTYYANAFLDGPYPTAAFPRAFDGFSPGAAALAAKSADVMTNATYGPEIDRMRALHREAHMVLFARDNTAQGASVSVVLDTLGHSRTRNADLSIRLTGDLYLAPSGGAWQVVGFRVLNETSGPDVSSTTTASTTGTSR
jgi:hypothetical protein